MRKFKVKFHGVNPKKNPENKIHLIKAYQRITGCGIRESKAFIESNFFESSENQNHIVIDTENNYMPGQTDDEKLLINECNIFDVFDKAGFTVTVTECFYPINDMPDTPPSSDAPKPTPKVKASISYMGAQLNIEVDINTFQTTIENYIKMIRDFPIPNE